MIVKTYLALAILSLFLFLTPGCDNAPTSGNDGGPIWVTFTRSSSPLLDNKINDLSSDAEGRMWVATDSGANAFDDGIWLSFRDSLSWTVSGSSTSATSRVVSSISETGGKIWFATKGGGLVRFNRSSSTKVWYRFTESNGLGTRTINWVAGELVHGEVWAGTGVGAFRYVPSLTIPDEGTWVSFTQETSPLPSSNIKVVEVNINNNSVWFGTYDKGLVYFDGDDQWQTFTIPPQYDARITSIGFDANSRVWVGRDASSNFSTNSGVSVLHIPTSTWTHYSVIDSNTNGIMPRGPVNAVVTNLNDSRWFGTNRGLVLQKDTTWRIFNRSNTPELPSDTIRALAYDSRQNLWIGTQKGIVVYNPEGTRLK
ncbi:MAG: hypothetical protein EPO24_11440 [Bacteroidetes bacterium]|nr:MAG: hypothetical protein EPO24_11440 [Bacteroidota bacterium]